MRTIKQDILRAVMLHVFESLSPFILTDDISGLEAACQQLATDQSFFTPFDLNIINYKSVLISLIGTATSCDRDNPEMLQLLCSTSTLGDYVEAVLINAFVSKHWLQVNRLLQMGVRLSDTFRGNPAYSECKKYVESQLPSLMPLDQNKPTQFKSLPGFNNPSGSKREAVQTFWNRGFTATWLFNAIAPEVLFKYVDVNAKFVHDNRNFLHMAAEHQPELVSRIVDVPGIDLGVSDKAGALPIHVAAQFHPQLVSLFVAREPKLINAKDALGKRPLHYVVRYHYEAIPQLLQIPGIEVNAPDDKGETALHCAVEFEIPQAIPLLLECDNINVNAQSLPMNSGKTPLVKAVSVFINIHAIRELMKHKCIDINFVLKDGQTIFDLAWASAGNSGRAEAMSLFFGSQTLDCSLTGKQKQTPLHFAVLICPELVPMLLDKPGFDVNAKDNEGYTALHLAAEYQPQLVPLLLSKGAQDCEVVTLRSFQNYTALDFAIGFKHADAARLLLKQPGVAVNRQLVGDCNRTMLHRAAQFLPEIVPDLLAFPGIDPRITDRDGATAADCAATPEVKLLIQQFDQNSNAVQSSARVGGFFPPADTTVGVRRNTFKTCQLL